MHLDSSHLLSVPRFSLENFEDLNSSKKTIETSIADFKMRKTSRPVRDQDLQE